MDANTTTKRNGRMAGEVTVRLRRGARACIARYGVGEEEFVQWLLDSMDRSVLEDALETMKAGRD